MELRGWWYHVLSEKTREVARGVRVCACVCVGVCVERERKRGGVGGTEMGKIKINSFYFVCLVNTVLNRLH